MYLNPAFLNKGLAEFEQNMDVNIQDWVEKLNRISRSKMALDLCV
jgi:hypothetical protein